MPLVFVRSIGTASLAAGGLAALFAFQDETMGQASASSLSKDVSHGLADVVDVYGQLVGVVVLMVVVLVIALVYNARTPPACTDCSDLDALLVGAVGGALGHFLARKKDGPSGMFCQIAATLLGTSAGIAAAIWR